MAIDTIWYTRCPVPTAFAIAVRLGSLDEEFGRDGITFRSLSSSPDDRTRQSHFEHSQANSVRHGGAIPPLVSRSRGGDPVVIGLSLSWSAQRVLSLSDSGIRGAADLAGKRLAVPRRVNEPIDFWRATVLRGYDVVLRQEGLSLSDVTLVDLPIVRRWVDDATSSTGQRDSLWDGNFILTFQRTETLALLRGEVDAIFTQGQTAATLPSLLGARIVGEARRTEEPSDYVNNQPFTLTISQGVLETRLDLAQRLVIRVNEAAEWARGHERAAKRIIAAEAGIAEDLVDVAYSPRVHEELGVDLTAVRVAALRTLHHDLESRGFLARPVEFSEFLDPRALEFAVNPSRHGVSLATPSTINP